MAGPSPPGTIRRAMKPGSTVPVTVEDLKRIAEERVATLHAKGYDNAFVYGTPEVGGPTSWQALEVVRALDGLNLVGCDLVQHEGAVGSEGVAFLGPGAVQRVAVAH